MKLLFRFLSLVFLLIAVVAGTMDSIQSVSSSSVELTSFGTAWLDFSPSTLMLAETLVEHYIHPQVWQAATAWLLRQPASAVFIVLSLLAWMIGYKKPPAAGRFAA